MRKMQLTGENADKKGLVTVMKRCTRCGCHLMADEDVFVCPGCQLTVDPLPGVLYKTLGDNPFSGYVSNAKKPIPGRVWVGGCLKQQLIDAGVPRKEIRSAHDWGNWVFSIPRSYMDDLGL